MSEPNTPASDGAPEPNGWLQYRGLDDAWVDARVAAVADDPVPVANGLAARLLKLETDGESREVLQIRPVPYGPGGLATGYELLDNEILAGRRLHRAQEAASTGYPLEVARLIGHDADAAQPYALLEPYRGGPIGKEAGNLLVSDHHPFQVSLLTGVRWLGAAGIAHRGLDPNTVRWDGRRVQITGFAHATVIGAPRTVVGVRPWCAPEQRPGRAEGDVTERDDLWAAGRLIFYIVTGTELTDPRQLTDAPELDALLNGVFGPPDNRPTALDLLTRLGMLKDPVPHRPGRSARFEQGREEFRQVRWRKHPVTKPKEKPPEPPAQVVVPPHPVFVILRRYPAVTWAVLAVFTVVLLIAIVALLTSP